MPLDRIPAAALIVTLALGILFAPLSADAQQPAKVPRIGVLEAGSGPSPVYEAFRQGLRDLGYVEGQNITIEYRSPGGSIKRLSDLAVELVSLKVDIIVTHGPPTIRAAQQATRTIPIVMAVSGDPVGEGFVASLARPGGNTTGLSIMATELSGKRLELLKEAVPVVTRVAVLLNPANRVAATQLKETQAAARALDVELQPLEVRDPSELDSAFLAMIRARAGAVIVLPDALFHGQYKRIAELAAKHRLPAMFWWREFAEAGGLMAYGADRSDLGRRTATFVDKILKGAKSSDLPVEQPTRFELVINLKTAKGLGLTIPQSILIRADEVIQ